jgi:hypothetical protein
LKAPEADPNGYGLNDEEFRRFQIDREIKRKYFKTRNELIREKYQTGQLSEERIENEQQFFESLKEDPEVTRLQTELDIKDKRVPTFEEIYEDVDRLLANAPVSIKKSMDQSVASGNTSFNPL